MEGVWGLGWVGVVGGTEQPTDPTNRNTASDPPTQPTNQKQYHPTPAADPPIKYTHHTHSHLDTNPPQPLTQSTLAEVVQEPFTAFIYALNYKDLVQVKNVNICVCVVGLTRGARGVCMEWGVGGEGLMVRVGGFVFCVLMSDSSR